MREQTYFTGYKLTSVTKEYLHPQCVSASFTLIELLVTIGIISILAGLLLPVLNSARENAKKIYCSNNLRQLYLANTMYADDNGCYVPASSDIFTENLKRWHGVRSNIREPFDASKGPLVPYLGSSGKIRRCPSFREYRTNNIDNAFEASCGGYGYNAIGVGSETYLKGYCREAMYRGMCPAKINSPDRTVMFCDCAFPQPYGNNPKYLIEYSFAEAYHWVFVPGIESQFRADPSIHFRHRGFANVVWCDGHISSERMETMGEQHFTKMNIGWFGPANNSLFDPY